jgi:hypothetical protein
MTIFMVSGDWRFAIRKKYNLHGRTGMVQTARNAEFARESRVRPTLFNRVFNTNCA